MGRVGWCSPGVPECLDHEAQHGPLIIYAPEEAADDGGASDGKSGPKWGEGGCPMVLENFLDAHYKNGIDISVVTNAAHYLRGKADHEELPAVQKWSDYSLSTGILHADVVEDRKLKPFVSEIEGEMEGHVAFLGPETH